MNLLSYPLESTTAAKKDFYSQATADYLLTGDLQGYRTKLASEFGDSRLYGFIDRLTGSREYRYVWRALAHSRRYGCSLETSCSRYRVDYDFTDTVSFLASDSALQRVMEFAESGTVIDEFTDTEEAHLLKSLSRFAKSTVHTKLQFLVTYDTGAGDIDDYIQTLLCKGMSTAWRYSHFTKADGSRDMLRITNYAKASIHKLAMSIIRTATGDGKARIRNHMQVCGTCPACERGDSKQCYIAAPAYEATVVSTDIVDGRGYGDYAEETEDDDNSREILAELVSTDPEVARKLHAAFGTLDIQKIATRCRDLSTKQVNSLILKAAG